MRFSHPLRLLASVFLAVAVIVIAPAGAYSGLIVKSAEGLVQLAQRKGTRLYRRGTVVAAPPDAGISTNTYTVEKCMETWDRGTHITKNRWREICKRQIKDIESTSGR